MNISFTLKHLRYFLALYESKHFGRAAEACFVTQPTLSAAIKEFEEIIGLQLFERTKRSVLITPAGEEIAERARQIIQLSQSLAELAQSQHAPLTGDLHLGVIPTIGPYLLPQLMPTLRKSYPDLKLFLREDQSARLIDSLRDGRLDILILALPYDTENVEVFPFMDDPFVVATPQNHPYADLDNVPVDKLKEENLLLLEEGHCLRDHALAACAWPTTQSNQQFAATSLPTLIQMVANGLGVTLLPQMAIDSGLTDGTDINCTPLPENSPPRGIGLVWRATSGRREEFRQLGQFFKETLER